MRARAVIPGQNGSAIPASRHQLTSCVTSARIIDVTTYAPAFWAVVRARAQSLKRGLPLVRPCLRLRMCTLAFFYTILGDRNKTIWTDVAGGSRGVDSGRSCPTLLSARRAEQRSNQSDMDRRPGVGLGGARAALSLLPDKRTIAAEELWVQSRKINQHGGLAFEGGMIPPKAGGQKWDAKQSDTDRRFASNRSLSTQVFKSPSPRAR